MRDRSAECLIEVAPGPRYPQVPDRSKSHNAHSMNAEIRPPRRATIIFIFVTVMLDMLALGMIIPVLPRLVIQFLQGDASSAARVFGLFGTAWALMQFVFSPILGALSDRFGRRLVILTSNFGLGLDYILMAVAPSLGWLFAGRVISGITAASIPTAYAYIADITPPEKRAPAFGMLGAAFGLGFVLGPAIGGLLGNINPRLPFWFAAGLSLTNAVYGLFVLPESLPRDLRSPLNLARANPVGSLTLLRTHPKLLGLALVSFLYFLAHEVLPATFVLYTTFRFDWSERDTGLALAVIGVCSAIVQAGLIRPIVATLGDRYAVLAALLSGGIGFAILGLGPTSVTFMAGFPLIALLGVSSAALQGLMTSRVDPSTQGRLQGTLASIRGISGLIGPGLFTMTFSQFITPGAFVHLPGAAFLLASGIVLSSLLVAIRVAHR